MGGGSGRSQAADPAATAAGSDDRGCARKLRRLRPRVMGGRRHPSGPWAARRGARWRPAARPHSPRRGIAAGSRPGGNSRGRPIGTFGHGASEGGGDRTHDQRI